MDESGKSASADHDWRWWLGGAAGVVVAIAVLVLIGLGLFAGYKYLTRPPAGPWQTADKVAFIDHCTYPKDVCNCVLRELQVEFSTAGAWARAEGAAHAAGDPVTPESVAFDTCTSNLP